MGHVRISSMRFKSRLVGPPPWSPTPYTLMASFMPCFSQNAGTYRANSGSVSPRYQVGSQKESTSAPDCPRHRYMG